MNFLPSFQSVGLAAAAAACAAVPLVIHLLNRRRFRVVHWAAMDFLREALQRNRRVRQFRDLLLLLLRTAAVLLVGLGLARPFFAGDGRQASAARQPLHAVLLIDNSLSMGYQSLEGSALDEAKRRAGEFVERLPAGSKISVIPLCGSPLGHSADPFESREHALEALQRIPVVGRSASISAALNQARDACLAAPELAKRLVLLTDLQQVNWRDAESIAWVQQLSVQVVDVRPERESGADSAATSPGSLPDRENTSVADIRLQDRLADTETPATIIVQLRHAGSAPREGLQVTLEVDGRPAGTRSVSLPAGQSMREVYFQHVFSDARPEPGRPREVVLRASIPPDRLPHDDQRHLVAHTVAALPVVFVDQYGTSEDVVRGRIGETRHLRQLLAPAADHATLIRVRHLTIDQVGRDQLADARLTVVAGVRDPEPAADVLADYVRQGGQLVIAAGGDFDPALWNDRLWDDGRGLLPLPLERTIGAAAQEAAGQLEPFFLDFDSLRTHQYFQLAGVAEDDLRDLYSEPLFFKAVVASDATATAADNSRPSDPPSDPPDDPPQEGEDERQRWVAWPLAVQSTTDQQSSARVLARFDRDSLPFLVERDVGEGRVLLVTSGLLAEWNTLPRTNAVLLFDRVLRGMLQSTLPRRNFAATPRLALPIPSEGRRLTIQLLRPDSAPEPLTAGFISRRQLGVTIQQPLQPGAYRLRALPFSGGAIDDPPGMDDAPAPNEAPTDAPGDAVAWQIPFAITAPSDESNLQPASASQLQAAGRALRLVEPGQPISLAGAQVGGQSLWWQLILAGLLLLLAELLLVAKFRRPAAAADSSASFTPAGAP